MSHVFDSDVLRGRIDFMKQVLQSPRIETDYHVRLMNIPGGAAGKVHDLLMKVTLSPKEQKLSTLTQGLEDLIHQDQNMLEIKNAEAVYTTLHQEAEALIAQADAVQKGKAPQQKQVATSHYSAVALYGPRRQSTIDPSLTVLQNRSWLVSSH